VKVTAMLKKNDSVPVLSLLDSEGNEYLLSELSNTILYFYPKDNTPGCTQQACGIRDSYSEILSLGWNVYGISNDSRKSHHNFSSKLSLPFKLLADEDKKVSNAFNVIKEKSLYGKLFKGISRTTFAINNGKVIEVWENVNAKEHSKTILDWIKKQK
jgi:thioredoxin-dependent peroxiredoxin